MSQYKITDSFGPLKEIGSKTTCYAYAPNEWTHDDMLYCGTSSGSVLYFSLTKRQRSRADELSSGNRHYGPVTCLAWVSDEDIIADKKDGILVSGSIDRSLKIWFPNTQEASELLLQTLYGHDGSISQVASGKGGMLISASIDGCFKVWLPQRGRKAMKFPFFECVYTVRKQRIDSTLTRINWVQAIATKTTGEWNLYVGDQDGSIDLYRKGSGPASEAAYSAFTGQLSFYKRWQSVHSLCISSLTMLEDDCLLISLGYDCTCKVSDASTGEVVIQVKNPRSCMFVGCIFDRTAAYFSMSDELGYITCYSWSAEKIDADVPVADVTDSRQLSLIMKSHKDQVMGSLQLVQPRPKHPGERLLVLMPTRGVVGMVEVIRDLHNVEFRGGHDDAVVSICPMLEEVRHRSDFGSRRPARIVREEGILFSVNRDTIISWSERDQSQVHQIKYRGGAEITAALSLWDYNLVVTGLDDGQVLFWIADASHSKISSRALKEGVTAFAEAHMRGSHMLLAADYSGRIAVFNLSTINSNPSHATLETSTHGLHDEVEPSILSLCHHPTSGLTFSGGYDCTVRSWRLLIDTFPVTYDGAHSEPVCSLECTEQFLVSGDMGGEIIVWRIACFERRNKSNSSATEPPGTLHKVAAFPSQQGVSRAVFSVLKPEVPPKSGNAIGSGFPGLWIAIGRFQEISIWFIQLSLNGGADLETKDSVEQEESVTILPGTALALNNDMRKNENGWLSKGELVAGVPEYRIVDHLSEGVEVEKRWSLPLDIEPTVLRLSTFRSSIKTTRRGLPKVSVPEEGSLNKPRQLYIGTAEGRVILSQLN